MSGQSISEAFDAAWDASSGTDDTSGGDDSFQIGMAGADVSYGDEIETADDPVEGHQEIVEVQDGAAEGDNTSFDWKQFSDQKVTVKVNGEEVVVPLGEALNGYMRQADYTKKTQAHAEEVKLAAWAQQLREAIQADPKGTIKYLADQYGLTDEIAKTEFDEFSDPEVKSLHDLVNRQAAEVRSMQEQMQQFEAERILREVRAELTAVQSEFPDLDPNVVLPLAADKGLSIREAYLLNESHRIISSRKDAEVAAAEAARVAQAEAAKRQAAGKTPKSAGVSGVTKVEPPKFDSFADMLKWNFDHAESVA